MHDDRLTAMYVAPDQPESGEVLQNVSGNLNARNCGDLESF